MNPVRRALALVALPLLLAACATPTPPGAALPRPEDVRARIVALMPASVPDRTGWAVDLYAALASLRLEPSDANVCAVLAVAEQESGFRVDPSVPGLGRIANAEIDRRADRAGVPRLLVHAALQIASSDGRSYSERLDTATTEKQLSDTFVDFIGQVPLGQRLFAGYNPVHTAGPMQVSVDFAERQVAQLPYPYPIAGTVRDEVFTRRGGVYFGTAHLLAYPANYDRMVYRFADFNAGRWASRNAAFQSAVASASGIPLDLDGDIVVPGGSSDKAGSTELAVRVLGPRLGMTDGDIRRALEDGETSPGFDTSRLWQRVFALADGIERRPLPRAVLPNIKLQGPKITRPLTTAWYARRVDERFQRCLSRAGAVEAPPPSPL